MKIELFTLCDGAYNYNGKLTIVGTVDAIALPDVPGLANFGLAIKLGADPTDAGKHELSIEILNARGERIPFEMKVDMDVKSSNDISHISLAANVNALPFKEFGLYTIKVNLDGNNLSDYPILVIKK